MNKTISSRMTFFYKFIFPTLWIGGFGTGTVERFRSGEPGPARWMFVVMWVVVSLLLAWGCSSLKRVTIDGADLVISNFLKRVRVPAAHIHDVTENLNVNIHPVWIHFKKPTPFGPKVMFMPTVNFRICCSHPVVAELKGFARQESLRHEHPELHDGPGGRGPS